MPHHYETIPSDLPHHYDTINDSGIYFKGKPVDLMKCNWYHGNVSEEQAKITLESMQFCNSFLVRHLENKLILSCRFLGWISHDIIHRSPGGYHLEGKEEEFKSVPEMIKHYKKFPIRRNDTLETAAEKTLSDRASKKWQS